MSAVNNGRDLLTLFFVNWGVSLMDYGCDGFSIYIWLKICLNITCCPFKKYGVFYHNIYNV